MSFFSWKKVKVETAAEVALSDEKKSEIDALVASWTTGNRPAYDGSEPPMQMLSAEEIDYFMHAMESEAARIDAEATELQKRRLAEIAERDAQIASINREIETLKAKAAAQDDEIRRRAEIRANLLEVVAKIEPRLDTSKITKDADIRREVVRLRFGDTAVENRSEAYIDERFESLAARANVDPFARVVADGLVSTAPSSGKAAADRAYADYVASLTEAHRTKH